MYKAWYMPYISTYVVLFTPLIFGYNSLKSFDGICIFQEINLKWTGDWILNLIYSRQICKQLHRYSDFNLNGMVFMHAWNGRSSGSIPGSV